MGQNTGKFTEMEDGREPVGTIKEPALVGGLKNYILYNVYI